MKELRRQELECSSNNVDRLNSLISQRILTSVFWPLQKGIAMANEPPVYEVFRREKVGAPMVHTGSVVASSPDLALIYAKEVYGRRGESSALWVAPREAFQVLDDADILHPALSRTYRLVEGYRMRDKLRAVQERFQGAKQ
jgi:ring-1,2-phenylacetyl-CoA epoxidase subunit PaaB